MLLLMLRSSLSLKMKSFLFAFLTFLLSEANAAKAPFIKPCKLNDNECIKASSTIALPIVAAGIPALGVPSGDPLFIEEANADQGDLKLTFKKTNVVGLSKCTFKSILIDEAKSVINVDLECPIQATGLYTLAGKLLFIPAEGEGDFEIKTDKVDFSIAVKYKTIADNNGEKHWKITSFDYDFELINKVFIKLENLFGGDSTKAKPVLELFDHSWKELITEVGKPIIKEVVSSAINSVKKFLLAVPLSETVL